MAFGGGCEFQMHSARTVAALESYIGLVEAGVGLLPAGGGLKEVALRAARSSIDGDPFNAIKKMFETIAMGKVSGSALEAKQLGLLRADDVIVFNSFELLHVAKQVARSMAECGWRPPLPARDITVAGDVGTASLKMMLVTLCGGAIERGSQVDETWLLDLERKHFVALAQMEKTQQRIAHTMSTGKPLRN